ncbi:MAG TPA: hypothetical protein VKU41_20400 [Polyangiaceae bacterium]|nr:hypothetical protein [Polyangiaceae bacterium]
MAAATAGCPVDDLLQGTAGHDGGPQRPPDATTAPADAGALKDETGASIDAAAADSDDASDASRADDGASLPDAPQDMTYYTLDDPARWSFFSIAGVANGTTKYSGAAFDGRYLYFVPNFSPPSVLRYDDRGAFTDPSSWTSYTPAAAIVAAGGSKTGTYTYRGGAFDGRYVYLAPFGSNAYALQFDTQQPFSQDAAWTAFNAATIDTAANYWGALSDGRYTYLVPNNTTKVVIYDRMATAEGGVGFGSSAAWSVYDLGTGNQGFWGGAYDGTYVYFAPFSGSVAARHDTILPPTSGWDVGATGFDFNNNFVLGTTAHFWGGAFDGHRVYMIPNQTQSWTLAAYATSGQFSDYGSWTTCALGSQLFGGKVTGSAFVGAAFDGRRLILVPYGSPASDAGVPPLPVVAYDTTQGLCPTPLSAAYTVFAPTTLDGGAGALGFEGAAFDGQYVYFVPHAGSVMARFEAKSVNQGLSPSVYTGSWW